MDSAAVDACAACLKKNCSPSRRPHEMRGWMGWTSRGGPLLLLTAARAAARPHGSVLTRFVRVLRDRCAASSSAAAPERRPMSRPGAARGVNASPQASHGIRALQPRRQAGHHETWTLPFDVHCRGSWPAITTGAALAGSRCSPVTHRHSCARAWSTVWRRTSRCRAFGSCSR
jgi:hypothetical protein